MNLSRTHDNSEYKESQVDRRMTGYSSDRTIDKLVNPQRSWSNEKVDRKLQTNENAKERLHDFVWARFIIFFEEPS